MSRERPIPGVVDGLPAAPELPTTQRALAYAGRVHDGQLRQVDGAPFIWHPVEVAALLSYSGAPDHVIAAGVLHDTLEKTDVTAAELCARFGPQIAALVQAVTDDQAIRDYARRKAALRDQVATAGEEALMVFAADKVSKVLELRRASGPAVRPRNRRLSHYRHCLQLLQRQLPDHSLVDTLRAELEALAHAAPPAPLLATGG